MNVTESRDLIELVLTDLKTQEIEGSNKAVYDNSFKISSAELYNHLQNTTNPPTKTYIQALLLLKLDEEKTTGSVLLSMLYVIWELFQSLPACVATIAYYIDGVLNNEIISFEDGDFITVAHYASVLNDVSPNTTSKKNASTKLIALTMKRLPSIIASQDGEILYQTLLILQQASALKYDLADVKDIIIDPVLNFIELRNEPLFNYNNIQENVQQDYVMIEIIEGFGIQDRLRNERINNIKAILEKKSPKIIYQLPPVINPSPNVDNSKPTEKTRVQIINNPGYTNIKIELINQSEINIIQLSIFARRTDTFQVAVHKGTYRDNIVAIKMYEAISPASR